MLHTSYSNINTHFICTLETQRFCLMYSKTSIDRTETTVKLNVGKIDTEFDVYKLDCSW